MKTSIALLAVGASFALAQSLSDLPPCGQTCISNMLGLGPSFGCKSGDTVCYCTEPNFGYGVRDCSNESCPPSDAATVIAYGEAYCKAILASASVSGSSALTVLSTAASAASSAASASSASAASVSASTTGGAGSVTAITTVPLVATISGSPVTTGFSTVFSSIGAGATGSLSSALSGASSAASAASAASKSASSAASEASNSASSAASAASGASSSAASAASASASSSSKGGAPMMTAAPGMLGAAGMAALLFI